MARTNFNQSIYKQGQANQKLIVGIVVAVIVLAIIVYAVVKQLNPSLVGAPDFAETTTESRQVSNLNLTSDNAADIFMSQLRTINSDYLVASPNVQPIEFTKLINPDTGSTNYIVNFMINDSSPEQYMASLQNHSEVQSVQSLGASSLIPALTPYRVTPVGGTTYIVNTLAESGGFRIETSVPAASNLATQ